MKRVIFLILGVLLLAGAVLAWQYSAQTTWNGTVHQPGTTIFTPAGTNGTMTICSRAWIGPPTCQVGGGWYYECLNDVWNNDQSTHYVIDIWCGGNQYGTGATLTTNEQWKIQASIWQPAGQQQYSAQGPVTAYIANPRVNCPGDGPNDE